MAWTGRRWQCWFGTTTKKGCALAGYGVETCSASPVPDETGGWVTAASYRIDLKLLGFAVAARQVRYFSRSFGSEYPKQGANTMFHWPT
jgi:hypothetical protein